jgi:hypothetical protein
MTKTTAPTGNGKGSLEGDYVIQPPSSSMPAAEHLAAPSFARAELCPRRSPRRSTGSVSTSSTIGQRSAPVDDGAHAADTERRPLQLPSLVRGRPRPCRPRRGDWDVTWAPPRSHGTRQPSSRSGGIQRSLGLPRLRSPLPHRLQYHLREHIMANHIYVFCASAELMSMQAVGQYIATIGLLDGVPSFAPPLESPAALDPAWVYLSVTYQNDKRPIQVHRSFTPEDMAPALEDALTMLDENGLTGEHPELVQALHASRQVFHIELGLEVPEDCWEMLNALESHIATSRQGVIVASDGFYDHNLKPICAFI